MGRGSDFLTGRVYSRIELSPEKPEVTKVAGDAEGPSEAKSDALDA